MNDSDYQHVWAMMGPPAKTSPPRFALLFISQAQHLLPTLWLAISSRIPDLATLEFNPPSFYCSLLLLQIPKINCSEFNLHLTKIPVP